MGICLSQRSCKAFLQKSSGNCSNRQKVSARSPQCTWGQEGGREEGGGEGGEEEGGGAQLAAELSREFICSHGNPPQSSREKNVGIGIKTWPPCLCSRAENCLSLSLPAGLLDVSHRFINRAQLEACTGL